MIEIVWKTAYHIVLQKQNIASIANPRNTKLKSQSKEEWRKLIRKRRKIMEEDDDDDDEEEEGGEGETAEPKPTSKADTGAKASTSPAPEDTSTGIKNRKYSSP